MDGIFFPGFGIDFSKVPTGFTVFGMEIKFYGVIISLGFILALLIASSEAKKSGCNEEDYFDYLLCMIIPVILGARLYYILFNLKEYTGLGGFGESLKAMVNIRNGGLGIYGGLITGVLVSVIFTKKRKLYLPLFADHIAMGVLVGQILGRWGNFFNREAFGAYTSSFLRMAIPVDYFKANGSFAYFVATNVITPDMLANTEVVNGLECITVMPTFLIEGFFNLLILLFIFFYRKKKKYDGELALTYVLGYGIGRLIVEAFRTDSLMIGPLKISQVVAVLCIVAAGYGMFHNLRNIKLKNKVSCHRVGDAVSENTDPDEGDATNEEKTDVSAKKKPKK